MTSEELQSQLDELHKELEKAKALAPEERDFLGHLMTEIVSISQGGLAPETPKESLRDQLEHKASEFETGHPRLAAVIRQVLDALNKMGI